METISNEYLTVNIDCHGAELKNIIRNSDQHEYLWHGDPAYWKRRSPVLFPIVGSVWEGRYRIDGREYALSQHGFARDMDFTLISNDGTQAIFRLDSNEETLKLYPREFSLEIGYRLHGRSIEVSWTVCNTSTDVEMPFQIGAHPAFNYMDYDPDAAVQGYFKFDRGQDSFALSLIGRKERKKNEKSVLEAHNGILPITRSSFNGDALVLENGQVHQVTLLDRQQQPYLSVTFDAPVVGLWSPTHDSYAPFVCIEPWYGRCDREEFNGDFADKDWVQRLAPQQSFSTTYNIVTMP